MSKDCGEIHSSSRQGTITDGIIANRAWQIFLAEAESSDRGFSQSEKDEVRNYLFSSKGLDSRPKLKELAEDCIKEPLIDLDVTSCVGDSVC